MPKKNTKTTTATRTRTVAEKPIVNEAPKEASTHKTFNDHDMILCHSVVPGGLYIDCRSGNFYEFTDCDGVCEIEYKDLVDLVRRRSDHIFTPTFVIDDDDFVAEFSQLKNFYDEMYSLADLKGILNAPVADMAQIINGLPSSVQMTLRNLAAQMIGTGEIDSVRKVKALSEIFKADFELLNSLIND